MVIPSGPAPLAGLERTTTSESSQPVQLKFQIVRAKPKKRTLDLL
jgi:hypothetical protein